MDSWDNDTEPTCLLLPKYFRDFSSSILDQQSRDVFLVE